jgi:hypothetical protein
MWVSSYKHVIPGKATAPSSLKKAITANGTAESRHMSQVKETLALLEGTNK